MMRAVRYPFVLLVLLLSVGVLAQPPAPEPPVYTYVAEWTMPRAQWNEFTTFFEKNSRPVLQQATSDGTLVSWGSFATYIHEEDQPTHGTWWAASSMAAIERVRQMLIKAPQPPAMAAAKHRDYLFRSIMHKHRTTAPTAGILVASFVTVNPGKGQEWRDFFEKNARPVFDEMLASGTISSYDVAVEDIHTSDPGTRTVWYTAPSMESYDKVNAAFQARNQQRSAEERRAFADAMMAIADGKTHRDYMATLPVYSYK